jgi:hypothetical protein
LYRYDSPGRTTTKNLTSRLSYKYSYRAADGCLSCHSARQIKIVIANPRIGHINA